MYTEKQIKEIEKQVENREELFSNEAFKLLSHLYSFRDNICASFINRPNNCPLMHSWKPSEKATKVFGVLNDALLKITEIIEN